MATEDHGSEPEDVTRASQSEAAARMAADAAQSLHQRAKVETGKPVPDLSPVDGMKVMQAGNLEFGSPGVLGGAPAVAEQQRRASTAEVGYVLSLAKSEYESARRRGAAAAEQRDAVEAEIERTPKYVYTDGGGKPLTTFAIVKFIAATLFLLFFAGLSMATVQYYAAQAAIVAQVWTFAGALVIGVFALEALLFVLDVGQRRAYVKVLFVVTILLLGGWLVAYAIEVGGRVFAPPPVLGAEVPEERNVLLGILMLGCQLGFDVTGSAMAGATIFVLFDEHRKARHDNPARLALEAAAALFAAAGDDEAATATLWGQRVRDITDAIENRVADAVRIFVFYASGGSRHPSPTANPGDGGNGTGASWVSAAVADNRAHPDPAPAPPDVASGKPGDHNGAKPANPDQGSLTAGTNPDAAAPIDARQARKGKPGHAGNGDGNPGTDSNTRPRLRADGGDNGTPPNK